MLCRYTSQDPGFKWVDPVTSGSLNTLGFVLLGGVDFPMNLFSSTVTAIVEQRRILSMCVVHHPSPHWLFDISLVAHSPPEQASTLAAKLVTDRFEVTFWFVS
jgi:hypothetical protein